MRKIFTPFIMLSMCLFLTLTISAQPTADEDQVSEIIEETMLCLDVTNLERKIEIVTENETVKEELLPYEDIELIALVTMAEAEGECEEGKRLVIDTILNRMDSEYFPDTAYEVIYQPSQFSSMWNGRVDRCYVMEDICELVRQELTERTNNNVMFFTAGDYGKYGVPMFQVENHYFSSYE